MGIVQSRVPANNHRCVAVTRPRETIHHVAERTASNEAQRNRSPPVPVIPLAVQRPKQPEYNDRDPQEDPARVCAEIQPECGARVVKQRQSDPVSDDDDFLSGGNSGVRERLRRNIER